MSKWVYIRTEPQLFTVGFYDPNGKFQTDSDWSPDERDAMRARVNFLNGGAAVQTEKDVDAEIEQCREWAAKFGGKTRSSVESIIRAMNGAQFLKTEKAMYFAGVKRLLVLMFDDLLDLEKAIGEFIDAEPDYSARIGERALFESILKDFAMFLVGRERK